MAVLSGDKPTNVIQGETTNLAKVFTVLAGGLGALAPALVQFFGDVPDAHRGTFYIASAIVISGALLMVAVVYTADLRARAACTQAAHRSARSDALGSEQGKVALVPGSVQAVLRNGGQDPVGVFALRYDCSDNLEYLVPKGDDLAWVQSRDVVKVLSTPVIRRGNGSGPR